MLSIVWMVHVHFAWLCLSLHQDLISARVGRRPQRCNTKVFMAPRLEEGERTVVILYHKPPNVVTSHSNKDAAPAMSGEITRRTVYDDVLTLCGFVGDKSGSFERVTGITSKLHAIGRLDAETSGLLLLTNDGGLVHHVTNPAAHAHSNAFITKTYEAVVMGNYETNSTDFQLIREMGVDIGAKYGGMTQPAKQLEVLGHPTAKSTLISITIAEGRNRQVRRMFHAIGSGVMKLKRTRIGSSLDLDGLAEGEWRLLTDLEVTECLGWIPKRIVLGHSRANVAPPRQKHSKSSKRRAK